MPNEVTQGVKREDLPLIRCPRMARTWEEIGILRTTVRQASERKELKKRRCAMLRKST